VHASDDVCAYLLNLVEATRQSRDLALGSSPRGGLATLALARAWAILQGRSYIIPDDIKTLAPYTLRHRLILSSEAHAKGKTVNRVFDAILKSTKVPLGPAR
jgi:MoxR-like ATPase